MIDEELALQQHCLASVTCLLAGFKLVNEPCRDNYRRLVKGLHGLHVYATEYWTEYLLCIAQSTNGLDPTSSVFRAVSELASRLHLVFGHLASQDVEGVGSESVTDARVMLLQQHSAIYKIVRTALQARSLKQLELELDGECAIKPEQSSSSLNADSGSASAADGVAALLAKYQQLVVSLLNEYDLPNISPPGAGPLQSKFSDLSIYLSAWILSSSHSWVSDRKAARRPRIISCSPIQVHCT